MSGFLGRAVASVAMAGLVMVPFAGGASALTARHLAGNQRYHHGYYRHYGYARHYGNPVVGPAVAGAALGIIGLAAGAAAANSYDRYDGGPGYGYAPSYSYNPYGYGY